jgi:hypothetical protein
MKELITMRKASRFLAVAPIIAIVTWIVFGGRLGTWLKGERTLAAAPQHSGQDTGSAHVAAPDPNNPGRTVLYWYDAMNPQHRYDKPGKAPDGMDLVPHYADDATDAGG